MTAKSPEPYVDPKFIQHPFPALAAGRSGKPQVLKTGGDQAVGSILFNANPTAEDTITLNGTVWTFKASGAAGNETDIEGSLAATLAALVSDLNGSADAELAKVTWSEDDTSLIATFDADGIAGNSYTLAGSGDVTVTDMTGGEGSNVISVDTEFTELQIVDGQEQNQAFSLEDGFETQRKTIYLSQKQDGNCVVTPDNLAGGTTITFDAAGEWCELVFLAGSWREKGGTATVA